MASHTTELDSEDVVVAREGRVGRITLDRPEAMNTFSTGLAVGLQDALEHFEDEQAVRAIVIDGAGDAFSAGIDVSEHAEYEETEEYRTWVERMEEPFHTIARMKTPVIAAAHGHAAANGLGLVAASDLAVAAEGTKLGATAPKVGLFCMGPSVPLMESLDNKRCLEMVLTGELIDAETGKEWGLLNRVTPAGDHVAAAMEFAETIASKSPMGVQMGKQAFYEMADMGYHEALEYSNEQFAALCTTADANEGIEAFLEGEPLGGEEWPGE